MKENEIQLESYPDRIQARLEKRARMASQNVPEYINGSIKALVIEDLKLWRVGVIKVSFKGGDKIAHHKIAEVAGKWSEYGNLKFDFGFNKSTGDYRKWKPNDRSHIRVGFEFDGYWSLVGNDSMDATIIQPGEITLNLSDFDTTLPSNWQGIVLHEFGHALGFHHEHQSPDADCDFDWPKLYDFLGGSPNYWTKAKVDHNLRQLTKGGLTYSAHDIHSIMHYSFPTWMFQSGAESPCFTQENIGLSSEDKKMMAAAYPFVQEMIAELDTSRIKSLTVLSKIETLPYAANLMHKKHLEYYLKHIVSP